MKTFLLVAIGALIGVGITYHQMGRGTARSLSNAETDDDPFATGDDPFESTTAGDSFDTTDDPFDSATADDPFDTIVGSQNSTTDALERWAACEYDGKVTGRRPVIGGVRCDRIPGWTTST